MLSFLLILLYDSLIFYNILGKSGGWRSEITVEQNDMLDQWIEAEMKGMEDLELQDMSTTQCL